jgi:pimeloyl-ACP methyl ester carboxylesterase
MRIISWLFLACALVANAADTTSSPQMSAAAPAKKFTFVLVHGAFAGGWEWKKLGEALQRDGHTVYRPTLTGQGERSHLASRDVGLSLHIQDIVNFILWEDLHDIVLVGHSYGGMVITGVVDQVPDRIKHVIYVDAGLPEDGESMFKIMGNGQQPPPSPDGFVRFPNMKMDVVPHVVPQSEKTFSQPISLHNQAVAQKLPTTYILMVNKGTELKQAGFYRSYERAKARGWKTIVMEGNHVVHLTNTNGLVQLLEQAP